MIESSTIPVQFMVVIITATVLGIIARRAKQPVLLAYLFTGIVLGPVFLDLVQETHTIQIMSELGLGFLLFLVGIEMNLDDIKEILRPISIIAVGQTILQTALAFVVPLALGFTMAETVIIALCTVFGATPVIVKILNDKDELKTLPGKIDVGVLVLQDIYLILVLALIGSGAIGNPQTAVYTFGKIVAMIGVIAAISMFSSKYFLKGLFDRIAGNRHAFFIHGIAWAFLFITISTELGLSVEVGAFLSGLGLGQIPHREELKERIRPLTDFFMVIFFSTLGLSLTLDNLLAFWQEALIASVVLMFGNFFIMFYLIDQQRFTPRTSFIGSINMTQVSEFSLVVGALAVTQGYIGNNILGYLSLMALLTISASTYLINYNEEIYQKVEKYLQRFESEEKSDVDVKTLDNHAVIVGYDEMGEKIAEKLATGYDVIVVDRNSDNTEKLAYSDYEYIYGDFKHGEIREAVRISKADFIVSLSPEKAVNDRILEDRDVDSVAIVKADGIEEAIDLYDIGADYVIIKNMLTGNRLSEYLELYLEDEELFMEEVEAELKQIRGDDISQN